jgi:hypothetical protein
MNYLNKKIKPLFREGLSLQLWKPHPNEEPFYDTDCLSNNIPFQDYFRNT